MNIIEIKDLNRYFGEGENRVHILKNVSLNIEKGDFVAIIGQSGSGKSTLMTSSGVWIRQPVVLTKSMAKKPLN